MQQTLHLMISCKDNMSFISKELEQEVLKQTWHTKNGLNKTKMIEPKAQNKKEQDPTEADEHKSPSSL